MPEVASQTLDTVGRELNAALAEARAALESYVEQPKNLALLERCQGELHQVCGVLRLLEIYGAALLAEEMEQVGVYLLATAKEKKSQSESLDALMRAMVQLPSYLERVLAGGRDLTLVLLPLLNDLRAVRGSALLSEGTLLLLNLKSDEQPRPRPPARGEPALSVEKWARRLRARFQSGLIGWIRGERPEQHLADLAAVAQKVEEIATRQPVFQLWWVIGAVIEALQENGLEAGVSVKRLLGLGDRELRRLYELGEARYAQSPPVELLNNLLYYVGRSESSGNRVCAVRESFRLAELLPLEESIEQERATLSAPSVKLMQTVATAIREDLSKVKDVLDIFVRRGAGAPKELGSQVELLRKIGDTLGVLGLGDLRARVQIETERLEKIVSGRLRANESALVEMAATLIEVEDRLDDQLVGLILPKPNDQTEESEDKEFQQVQAAVLRECILNLARIKEIIAQSVGGTLDAAGLDSWQELMRGLRAGLLMLGKVRAVEIVAAITVQLKRILQIGGRAAPAVFIDRLADAIVSVEYYMETLQAGRSDPWYMLDNAQACVQALASQNSVIPKVPALDPSAFTRTVQMPGAAGTTEAGARSAKPQAGISDPELLKLFIEEAHEEVTKIQRHYPAWEQNPQERDALVTVRRSFHTLKGSGRMVGARDLGEFAWSTENLLNRLLDATLQRTPAIVEVLREAVAVLPELIANLESGQPLKADAAGISLRAHTLAAGGPSEPTASGQGPEDLPEPAAEAPAADLDGLPAEVLGPAGVAAQPGASAAEAEGSSAQRADPASGRPSTFDDALREIYSRETSAHVATVRGYLAREAKLPEPHFLPEDVYRACHTLSGSSKMAQARHGIRLAEPLDHWLRRVFSSGVGLRNQDLAVLADCMAAMEATISHLDEATGYFVDHLQLQERIVQADKALDQRIGSSTASYGLPKPAAPPEAPPTPAASPFAELDLSELGLPDPGRRAGEVTLGPASQDRLLSCDGLSDADEEQMGDFDPEVAAIFGEEALELLDASQEALMNWRTEPNVAEYRTALQRPLHTLKGGARMAGLSDMGDLSHELETLVMQIDHGVVTADERVFEIMQASLDELARMREQVASGHPIAPAQGMIARIQVLYRGAPASPRLQTPMRPASGARPASPQPGPSRGTEPPKAPPKLRPVDSRGSETLIRPLNSAALRDQRPASPEPRPPARPAPRKPVPPTGRRPNPSGGSLPAGKAGPDELERTLEPGMLPKRVLAGQDPENDWRQQESLSPASTSVSVKFGRSGLDGRAAEEGLLPPQPVPPGREPAGPAERQEMARVDAELLDTLLNTSGEASIARARLEQQVGAIDFNTGELSRTVIRLKDQLRSLEIETEAQIRTRHVEEGGPRGDFDPLELDRYSVIQQFSRALAETANDVGSLQQTLDTLSKDTQNLLQQQARMMTELQNGLMRTRMVPFQRHVQRLARIVRQAAADTGKRAEVHVEGAAGELDRQVLERMLPPFEHMLRNAVVHGIERPEERVRRGKSETGRIVLEIHREGNEVMVRLSDDGGGMNLKAIREKGLALGLIKPGQSVGDEDAMQLILEPGFSTAGAITQQAGRGVGMDVVATEIKRLGGALHMETKAGEGTVFTIRLPFTLAISHALVVRAGDEFYALPLPMVEGVLRLSKNEVIAHLGKDAQTYDYGGQKYRFQPLATFVGLEPSPLPEQDVTIPVVLVRAGEHSTGLVADELVGSREIVVKSVGPQISSIRGISGATILGDGRIVIILDIGALVRAEWRTRPQVPVVSREKTDRRPVAMVVDDSITVRRVTQRLLERNGMRVIIARDGMDAVQLLKDSTPHVILLDIEMPRMDGYEVATQVRNDPRLRDVPIIMITSRVGEKHRARAVELGIDEYLGKPYQEAQLLKAIRPLIERFGGGDETGEQFYAGTGISR
jgi:chemosensory pili system protein ChpA (sensor histidine kinase/response regulator)